MTDRYGTDELDATVEPQNENDGLFEPETETVTATETVQVSADPTVAAESTEQADGGTGVTNEAVATEAASTDTQAEGVEAKPAGPTEEEIAAAVRGFQEYLVGAEYLDADPGNEVEGGILVSDERDPGTGVLSDALKTEIKQKYIDLPAGQGKDSARQQVKEWVKSLIEASIVTLAGERARTFFLVQSECLNAKGAGAGTGSAVVKQVDPVEEYVNEVVALYIAPYLLPKPEGTPDDVTAKVNARAEELFKHIAPYSQWLYGDPEQRGDEPEVPDEVRRAGRIATGKATRAASTRKRAASGSGEATTSTPRASYNGPRRDVAKHVAEYFAGQPSGYVALMGEIAKFQSTEYGDDRPSSGAVTARIWPTSGNASTISGVEAVMKDGKKAARWVGVSA